MKGQNAGLTTDITDFTDGKFRFVFLSAKSMQSVVKNPSDRLFTFRCLRFLLLKAFVFSGFQPQKIRA
jgi:hypothetical protein